MFMKHDEKVERFEPGYVTSSIVIVPQLTKEPVPNILKMHPPQLGPAIVYINPPGTDE
jgi:hypothetical protein